MLTTTIYFSAPSPSYLAVILGADDVVSAGCGLLCCGLSMIDDGREYCMVLYTGCFVWEDVVVADVDIDRGVGGSVDGGG